MNDDLEEGERRADGVSMKSECGGSSQKAVHNVVGIRSEADKKEQLGAFFDCAYDAFDCGARLEPAFDGIPEERARDDKYNERTEKRCKIRNDSACPWAKSVSR